MLVSDTALSMGNVFFDFRIFLNSGLVKEPRHSVKYSIECVVIARMHIIFKDK